jgi:hypothetical protein
LELSTIFSKNKGVEKMNKVETAIDTLKAIGDCIKEAGHIPSGTLYALLMTKGCSLENYNKIIDAFKSAGVVKEMDKIITKGEQR